MNKGERGFSVLRGGRRPGWSTESSVVRVAVTRDAALSGERIRRDLGAAGVTQRSMGLPQSLWKALEGFQEGE